MNEYGWIYDWTLMHLKDFKEPLLFFQLIYFRNSFCYRKENSWGFRYKILGHVGPLGKNLNFLSPLGSLKFEDFLSFLFMLKLSYSKPFHKTLKYASTANIEEVMQFYNLGDKTFEADFNLVNFRWENQTWKEPRKVTNLMGLIWMLFHLWLRRAGKGAPGKAE